MRERSFQRQQKRIWKVDDMFEEYLEDAQFFIEKASKEKDILKARRLFRVSILCIMNALESFINYVSQILESGKALPLYERAFLSDKKFGLIDGQFEIQEQWEFHRLEDKLRFLLNRFDKSYNFETNTSWCRFLELKRKRDELTHPREDYDDTEIEQYETITKNGINAIIEIMDNLCKGTFKKGLRQRIIDLKFSVG